MASAQPHTQGLLQPGCRTAGTWLHLRMLHTYVIPRHTCWRTLRRTATSVQSKVENSPPHTAKLPPILGASRRMACAGATARPRPAATTGPTPAARAGRQVQQASGTVAAHLKAAAKARVAGRVAHALEQVPQAAACARSPASQRTPPGPCAAQGSCAPSRRTNCAHPERPAYVVQHSVGAGLAPVVYAGGRHPAALSGSRPSSPLPLCTARPRSTASAQPCP